MSETTAGKKQALDGTRLNAFGMEPEALTLVTDKKHPLYDERVTLALDENMVKNVMAYGVIEPVIVTKEGDKVLVVAGRQRVKWALEANKRLRAAGSEPLKVPCMLRRGQAGDLFGVTISENEVRQDDSPVIKAKKTQRYLDLGHSEEEAAVTFGVSVQTIRQRLKVLEAAPEVQKALEEGRVTQREAAVASKAPKAEQAKVAAQPKKARAKKVNRKALKSACRKLAQSDHLTAKVRGVLSWVAGDIDYPALAEILELKKS